MISTIAMTMMLAMAPGSAPPPIEIAVPPPILLVPAPPAPPVPPPPPAPRRVEPARARANLPSLISEEDYPASAIRAREEGMVGFRLIVGPNGRVTNCVITASSKSAALDSTTCRLLTSRARFTPARNSSGEPTSDSVSGRIFWRLVNDFDRPWAPALFVEEMRSTAAGAVTCWQGWPPASLWDEACPPEASGLAARARLGGRALTRSVVTRLTPEGMTEAADRPGRGDLFLSADATFTIGADGKLLECRVLRNEYLGLDRRRGAPPNPCADWGVGTNNLYQPAPDGKAARKVDVKVRGYLGLRTTPAP